MDGREFVDRFTRDEDEDGVAVALRLFDREMCEDLRVEFNVWILTADRATGTLHFVHDFEPLEGEMPLTDFIREITTGEPARADDRRDSHEDG